MRQTDPKNRRFFGVDGAQVTWPKPCYAEQLACFIRSPDLLFQLFGFLVGFVVLFLVSILRILLLFPFLPLLLSLCENLVGGCQPIPKQSIPYFHAI